VREDLSPAQFVVEYLSIQKPVLIRGGLTGACGTSFVLPASLCIFGLRKSVLVVVLLAVS
jgi:hypothetical protein